MTKVLLRWPRWAACSALAVRVAVADPTPASPGDAAPAESAPSVETAPDGPPDAAPSEAAAPAATPPADAGVPESAGVPPGEAPPGEMDPADAAGTETEAQAEVPAPPELPRTSSVAPPPNPRSVPFAPPAPDAVPSRGPFGWSAGTTRTVGWITFAVSAAAGVGLTAAGIAACSGQHLGCIQGQPLIWSGAAVGLSGIPVGLTLVVRGGQLSMAPQASGQQAGSQQAGSQQANGPQGAGTFARGF